MDSFTTSNGTTVVANPGGLGMGYGAGWNNQAQSNEMFLASLIMLNSAKRGISSHSAPGRSDPGRYRCR